MAVVTDVNDAVRLLAGIEGNTKRWSNANLLTLRVLALNSAYAIGYDSGGRGVANATYTSSVASGTATHPAMNPGTTTAVDAVYGVDVLYSGDWVPIKALPFAERGRYTTYNDALGLRYHVETLPYGDTDTTVVIRFFPIPTETVRIRVHAFQPYSGNLTTIPQVFRQYVIYHMVQSVRMAENQDPAPIAAALQKAERELRNWFLQAGAEGAKVADSEQDMPPWRI